MSAYINASIFADNVRVTYRDDGRFADDPKVIVRVGMAEMHLSVDTARKLAEDILAALPAEVSA